jgi:tankyrase
MELILFLSDDHMCVRSTCAQLSGTFPITSDSQARSCSLILTKGSCSRDSSAPARRKYRDVALKNSSTMMEYQVPSGRLSIYEESVSKLFDSASEKIKKIDYNASKELAKLSSIDMATVRDHRNQNRTLLHIAAGFGRKSWVTGLLMDGADANAQDDEGQTPLHAACNHAHKTVARILIEAGADVNLTDHKGWPALHFALARRENALKIQPHYFEVVELLLRCGADPYLESATGKNSITRITDAEQRRHVRLIHLLNLLENYNCDSLEMPQVTRDSIIEKYLRVNDFFELVKIGDDHFEIIEKLITPRLLNMRLVACDNITPLHRAAGYNHLEVAKSFIRLGANVNATDAHGRIPLHNAAKYGHIEMIELLIEGGSEIDKQDLEGYSPIHVAASNGTFIACLRLIELGANKYVRSNAGELPYDLADSDDVKEVLILDKVQMVPSSSEQAVYIGFQEEREPNSQLSCSANHDLNCKLQTHMISEPDSLMLDSSSDERLFSNPQHKIKKVILDKSDSRYQLVKRRMLESIVSHSNDLGGRFSSYDIISIELILHEKVWAKYRLACQRLEIEYDRGSKNEKLLFHGSNLIDKIQTYGFDERYAQRNGMFGAGLYFGAHSSKSNQYTFGFGQGCKEHKDKSCYVCERKMIYAQVALGKSLISKEAMPDCAHAPPGYSSVTGLPEVTEDLVYPEYVIYNGDQAYPLFVITYRIKP